MKMYRAKNTVLIINEGLSDNFGDQIIKESMLHLVNAAGLRPKFQDLTRHKASYTHQYEIEVSAFKRRRQFGFLKPIRSIVWKLLWVAKNLQRITSTAIYKYDSVVIGGGQLLLSNGIFPLALLVWVSLLRIRNHGKIVLFSVGMQGEYGKVQKMILSYVLGHTSQIFVRDELSKNILKDHFESPSTLTFDSAFIYGQVHIPRRLDKKFTHLMGIVDYRIYCHYADKVPLTRDQYYETWLQLLGGGADLRSVALIYATPEDRAECLQFIDYVKETHSVNVELLENTTYRQFLDNLELGGTIVSGRMHSLILSLVLRKHIIPYPISEKIQSFLERLGDSYDVSTIEKQVLNDFNNMISEVIR